MSLSPSKFNSFIMFKLPSAWLCGVRVKEISEKTCTTTVKHKWINQNPFNSMFWAVQGMAAELSTGAMVINQIRESGKKISMLVANNKASFTKKATGKITFTCKDGHKIADAIEKTIATGEGQTFWMQSVGVNEDDVVVSTFDFEWTVRVKS
ncbi:MULTISPECIES: DUF4442 domain-containing protein [Leeuwenhoekiella]|uniref:DUF4442 domain-containing protein n=1 Tax=Leeuwenhoekiella TaxID=283735 RepID=UPI000C469EA7|nr:MULTISPECIES: DUF4442 domain-containing protein [Leeuwenhoekiella]MAO42113.1 thioesterase [Leeuwenhoekiella sp.]MBQ51535.1 thioesterase [Leeuwenhoekiella sp.]HBT10291.1 thioesterase [Leeuwenhoekiella sp.]HCW65053.1 thioesterase [Leeuwenhoekiella sp.]